MDDFDYACAQQQQQHTQDEYSLNAPYNPDFFAFDRHSTFNPSAVPFQMDTNAVQNVNNGMRDIQSEQQIFHNANEASHQTSGALVVAQNTTRQGFGQMQNDTSRQTSMPFVEENQSIQHDYPQYPNPRGHAQAFRIMDYPAHEYMLQWPPLNPTYSEPAHLQQQQQRQQQSPQQQQPTNIQYAPINDPHGFPPSIHQAAHHLGYVRVHEEVALGSRDPFFQQYPHTSMQPQAQPINTMTTLMADPYRGNLDHALTDYPVQHRYAMRPTGPIVVGGGFSISPTDTLALQSSPTDEVDWAFINDPPARSSFESFVNIPSNPGSYPSNFHPDMGISNPAFTLHIRSDVGSPHEDAPLSAASADSFNDLPFPMDEASPAEMPKTRSSPQPFHNILDEAVEEVPAFPSARSSPLSSPPPTSAASSPPRSPPARARRNTGKSGKVVPKRNSISKVEKSVDRKVGKRKGPLNPEQRKQAGEIRKMGACLRCKYLKKTCDTEDICAGCKPSHARLWQVPCTRQDIKDLGYFLVGWDVDHARHQSLAYPTDLVVVEKSFTQAMWFSHGYGFCFPIKVREVVLKDNRFSIAEWEEKQEDGAVGRFNVATADLAVDRKTGIDVDALHAYVDSHIDKRFAHFVEKYFAGLEYISETLMTAFNLYKSTNNAAVKKVLKLLVTYNLTTHCAFVEKSSSEYTVHEGKIKSPASAFVGMQAAPVMVAQSIRDALASMWRDLHKDVLADLTQLFRDVYNPPKDQNKLKNWPQIVVICSVLLVVWEEMQFDARRRDPDQAAAEKFCNDMEHPAAGVITGLFSAVATKLPPFADWNTAIHRYVFDSDPNACKTMEEIQANILKHDEYLRTRNNCSYDADDVDSLSNKFLSKLVIKV